MMLEDMYDPCPREVRVKFGWSGLLSVEHVTDSTQRDEAKQVIKESLLSGGG